MERGLSCDLGDIGCGIGEVVSKAASDGMSQIAEDTIDTFESVMTAIGSFWVYIPTPNLAGGTGSNSAVVDFIQSSLGFYVMLAAVISILIAATKIILTQRGEGFAKIARGLLVLALVTTAGIPLLSVLILAADEFSVWFIERSTGGGNFGANLAASMGLASVQPIGALLVIILGIVAIVAAVTQVVLILVRMVMLVILAGMLPMAASFASQDEGIAWLKKYGAWLAAFLLYKPVAAIIYGTAYKLIAGGVFNYDDQTINVSGQALMSMLGGLLLMVLAVVALGPLMRFLIPAVGAIGGSGAGGGDLAAGVGAGASGAMSIAGMKASSGGGRASGASTPSFSDSSASGASNVGSGSRGATGGTGAAGSTGTAGAGAASSAGGGAAAGAGAAGGAASGGAAAAGGAAAGAGAGSAAGPVGMAAGAVVGTAVSGAGKVAKAVSDKAEQSIDEGPRGSN